MTQPLVSPDGNFTWDGTQWVPVNQPTATPTADPTSTTTATGTDASSATNTTPPPDAAPAPAMPSVGTVVAYTFDDPYSDAEVTRYGLVIAQHPADPTVSGSVDRAEVAWLPEGSALLDVTDLDQL